MEVDIENNFLKEFELSNYEREKKINNVIVETDGLDSDNELNIWNSFDDTSYNYKINDKTNNMEYDILDAGCEALNEDCNVSSAGYEALNEDYKVLSAGCEALNKDYKVLSAGCEALNEECDVLNIDYNDQNHKKNYNVNKQDDIENMYGIWSNELSSMMKDKKILCYKSDNKMIKNKLENTIEVEEEKDPAFNNMHMIGVSDDELEDESTNMDHDNKIKVLKSRKLNYVKNYNLIQTFGIKPKKLKKWKENIQDTILEEITRNITKNEKNIVDIGNVTNYVETDAFYIADGIFHIKEAKKIPRDIYDGFSDWNDGGKMYFFKELNDGEINKSSLDEKYLKKIKEREDFNFEQIQNANFEQIQNTNFEDNTLYNQDNMPHILTDQEEIIKMNIDELDVLYDDHNKFEQIIELFGNTISENYKEYLSDVTDFSQAEKILKRQITNNKNYADYNNYIIEENNNLLLEKDFREKTCDYCLKNKVEIIKNIAEHEKNIINKNSNMYGKKTTIYTRNFMFRNLLNYIQDKKSNKKG
jgi:hypothetical protein